MHLSKNTAHYHSKPLSSPYRSCPFFFFTYLGGNTIIFRLFFILILSWIPMCQILTWISRGLYFFPNLSRTTWVFSVQRETFYLPNTYLHLVPFKHIIFEETLGEYGHFPSRICVFFFYLYFFAALETSPTFQINLWWLLQLYPNWSQAQMSMVSCSWVPKVSTLHFSLHLHVQTFFSKNSRHAR